MNKNYMDTNLCAKVVWYYYFGEMTQQQIADKLKISRVKVVRLLETAKETGIIQFHIRTKDFKVLKFEKELQDLYGLDNVFIVPSVSVEHNENIARATACFIEELLSQYKTINIDYGDTVKRMLNRLHFSADADVQLFTLTGGINYYIRFGELVDKGSSIDLNSKLHVIPSPLVVSTKELAEAIQSDDNVQRIKSMSKNSDVSILSIGSVSEEATMFKEGILNKDDLLWLKMHGAVGELLGKFFNSEGEFIYFPLLERMITNNPNDIRQMRNVIGIGGGLVKAPAIAGALKTGCIDILITDMDTAKMVLEINEHGS